MAVSYVIRKRAVAGNTRRHLVDVTIGVAGDYSSGVTLTPASVGLTRIDAAKVAGASGVALLVSWQLDISSGLLRAYKGAGSAVFTEVAGADVAAGVVRLEVIEYQNT